MLEHGATKSRNRRTRKERWVLLAAKFKVLQTSLETSPSCDGQTNGRRAHGWLLLYGSFWSEQQSICKHESCLSGTSHSHLSGTLIHGLTELGGAANTALSQNALRQDRSWWIAFVICCAIQDCDIYSSGLAWAICQLKVFFFCCNVNSNYCN